MAYKIKPHLKKDEDHLSIEIDMIWLIVLSMYPCMTTRKIFIYLFGQQGTNPSDIINRTFYLLLWKCTFGKCSFGKLKIEVPPDVAEGGERGGYFNLVNTVHRHVSNSFTTISVVWTAFNWNFTPSSNLTMRLLLLEVIWRWVPKSVRQGRHYFCF